MRIELSLQTAFNEINDSIFTLLRQPKKFSLKNVTIDNVSVEFAEILRNCEEVKIYNCKFKTVQSFKTVLLSCKNLKVFRIYHSEFDEGIIEGIIADAQHERGHENAEIGLLSIKCMTLHDSWELMKTFKALGIQLKSLDLEIRSIDFTMEILEYIKENYETKLKNLKIITSKAHNSDALSRHIGKWNNLQLDSLCRHRTGRYGSFDRLIERQTALKHLEGMKILNIERFPISLRHIHIEIDQDYAQNIVDKLSELKHLHHLHIQVHCDGRCKLNFSVLRHLIQLQELILDTIPLEEGCGIELDLQDLCTPLQKMRDLAILDGQFEYKTMQKIIENMPNLYHLHLSDLPKMVSVSNFTFGTTLYEYNKITETSCMSLYPKHRLSYFFVRSFN
jgi:hypothetical protein